MKDSEDDVKDVRFMLHKSRSFKSLRLSLFTLVSEVKVMVCSNEDMKHEECEILFCGHTMKNEDNLHHYNIGPETVLHVVFRPKIEPDPVAQNACLNLYRNSYLTGIWLHRKGTNFMWNLCSNCNVPKARNLTSKHPHFYLFCKKKCQSVRVGKLRVRCMACKEDSIMLNSDPCEWGDVMRPGQISGSCFSEHCCGERSDAEFYFKCSVCGSTSADPAAEDVSVPLRDVCTNTSETACITCFEAHDPIVTFPCNLDHALCLDCFEQYARSSLRERQFFLDKNIGYTIACPEKCEGSFLKDIHLFHVLGVDEYRTYQALAAEECLFREMKGMVCPNPGCGMGLYPDLPMPFANNTEIKCTSCGYAFCSSCRERFHGNSKCYTDFPKRSTSGAEVTNYMATIKMIKQISKNCPNCKAPTERNGGCMHMTCRMCKYEWCWNCLTSWSYDCQGDHWFM